MTGVLLMAHGTPSSTEEMAEYLRVVRGGRPPSPELVEEMTHNYEAIGGASPLTAITRAQGRALQERLGADARVAVGMRNWKPFISEAIEELAASGVTRIVAIPLAPQFSTLSTSKYFAAAATASPAGVELDPVRAFASHPLLLDAFAERIEAADPAGDEEIIFTAHSLPERAIASGDPYADEVAATTSGVAARAGITRYHCGYQSAGRTPEPWIGPDVCDLVRDLAARGARRFLIVPIGFVCDHTEILFDIDVQASAAAREAGAELRRIESLNTSPTFIAMLEDLVRQRL